MEMKLEQLQALSPVTSSEFIPEPVTWAHPETGAKHAFVVHVKARPSLADIEFIQRGPANAAVSDGGEDTDSGVVRTVARLVRLDGGREKIPLATAAAMHPSLLMALAGAVNSAVAKLQTTDAAITGKTGGARKNSRRKTNSSTS